MGKGVYVASRASIPARGAMWRQLRDEGWPIISTWIDEDGPGQSADLGDLWTRILCEIEDSDGLILYVEPGDFPMKGALIEVGAALAAGLYVQIVAPGVDVDHRSFNPIGSWMKHPLVERVSSVYAALDRLGIRKITSGPS